MNDFSNELTAMLDDAAATINPQPDFEGAKAASNWSAPKGAGGRRRFSRAAGIAAVSVALLGGGVAAFEVADGKPHTLSTSTEMSELSSVAPPSSTIAEDEHAAADVPAPPAAEVRDASGDQKLPQDSGKTVERTAKLGTGELDQDPMAQKIHGRAAPGETVTVVSDFGTAETVAHADGTWELTLELSDVVVGDAVSISVSFSESPLVFDFVVERREAPVETTKPSDETKPEETPESPGERQPPGEPQPPAEPAPIAFTSNLGATHNDDVYMKQGFYGSAPAGSAVTISSAWGAIHTTADSKGGWEEHLKLTDVPDGAVVLVRVFSSASDHVFEHELVRRRPAPEPAPEAKPFTANLGTAYLDWTPMKQYFTGTGTPGSKVVATSEFGSADVVVGAEGVWELKLQMYDVPGGATVGVLVSNSVSDAVFDFSLVRPMPEAKPFTANLGTAYLDWTPMKQYFAGTGTPGSTVVATSEFGSADVVVGAEGLWELKLQMYEVPGGTTVGVLVTNSVSDAVFDFSLVRPMPAPEPPTAEFTANAALVESDAVPLINEYWGTSTAGAVVTISSPYGGGQVTANGDALWDARIEFSGAPVGESFTVTITSSKDDAVHAFSFTNVAPI